MNINKPGLMENAIQNELCKLSSSVVRIADEIYPQNQSPLAYISRACVSTVIDAMPDQFVILNKTLVAIADVEKLFLECRKLTNSANENDIVFGIINSRITKENIVGLKDISLLENHLQVIYDQLKAWKRLKEKEVKQKEENKESVTDFESRKDQLLEVYNHAIGQCPTPNEWALLEKMRHTCVQAIDNHENSFKNYLKAISDWAKNKEKNNKEVDPFNIFRKDDKQEHVKEQSKREVKEEQHVKGSSYNDIYNARYNELEIIYQRAKKNCVVNLQLSLLNDHYHSCFNKVKIYSEFCIAMEKLIQYEADLELYAKMRSKHVEVKSEEEIKGPDMQMPTKDWGKWGAVHNPEYPNSIPTPQEKEDLVIQPLENTIFKQPETRTNFSNLLDRDNYQQAHDKVMSKITEMIRNGLSEKRIAELPNLNLGEQSNTRVLTGLEKQYEIQSLQNKQIRIALANMDDDEIFVVKNLLEQAGYTLLNILGNIPKDQPKGFLCDTPPVKWYGISHPEGYDNAEAMRIAIAKLHVNQPTKQKRKGKYYKK